MASPRNEVEQLRVRVGHDDRDACRAALLEHHLAGRLTVEELERREQAALDAVTTLDLARLLADLPPERPSTEGTRPVPLQRRDADAEFWALAPRDRARRMAVWAAPPATLVTGAAIAADITAYDDGQQFTVALAATALGYVTHWVQSRFRR